MLVTTKLELPSALVTKSRALLEVGTKAGGAPNDTTGRHEEPSSSHRAAATKRRPGPVWADMYRRN